MISLPKLKGLTGLTGALKNLDHLATHFIALHTMTQPIPTVAYMLDTTRISHRVHRWPTEGGSIDVGADVLRPALESACDPTMANWPAMVEVKS
jgi:hypothetical protein